MADKKPPEQENATVPKAKPEKEDSGDKDKDKDNKDEGSDSKDDAKSDGSDKDKDGKDGSSDGDDKGDKKDKDKDKGSEDTGDDKGNKKEGNKGSQKGKDEGKTKQDSEDDDITSKGKSVEEQKEDADAKKLVEESEDKKQKSSSGKKKQSNADKLKKEVAKKGSSSVASAVTRQILLQKFLLWLKMMLAMIANAIAQAIAAAIGWIMNIINTVIGFFQSVGSAIASAFSAVAGFLGVSTVAVAATTIGGGVFAVVCLVGTIIGSTVTHNAIRDDASVDPCKNFVQAKEIKNDDDANVDTDVMSNAEKIYQVFHKYGIDNIRIAGCLGNLQRESGIKPYTIEGLYDDDGKPDGVKWKQAMADLPGYGQGFYEANSPKHSDWNWDYYYVDDSELDDLKKEGITGYSKGYYVGIGLAQNTGPGNIKLQEAGKSLGAEWYTVDAQLVYWLKDAKDGGDTETENIRNGKWLEDSVESVEDATYWWYGNIEYHDYGSSECKSRYTGKNAGSEREAYAKKWLTRIKTKFEEDDTYANSILEAAAATTQDATANAVKKAADSKCEECEQKTASGGNGSIAQAAITMSYMDKIHDQDGGTTLKQKFGSGSWGANEHGKYKQWCTEKYIKVKDTVLKNDSTYYASCDRGTVTAVRWSGADDNMQGGHADEQGYYCYTHTDKWELVATNTDGSDITFDELQPGDICYRSHTPYTSFKSQSGGHTWTYIGLGTDVKGINSEIDPYIKDDVHYKADCSYGSHGFRVAEVNISYFNSENTYVFRNVKPEENSKYKGAEITTTKTTAKCKNKTLSGDFVKSIEIDGKSITLPGNVWQYSTWPAESGDKTKFTGDDTDRGVGEVCVEDADYYKGDDVYAVNCRWSYAIASATGNTYSASANGTVMKDLKAHIGQCGITDSIISQLNNKKGYVPSGKTDSTEWATGAEVWSKVKFLLYNPDNGEAVVCHAGSYKEGVKNGNCNWGGQPSHILLGASEAALKAIHASGQDWLELYIVNDTSGSMKEGPYSAVNLGNSTGSGD